MIKTYIYEEFSEKVINLRKVPFIFKTQNFKILKTFEEYSNFQTENITTMVDSLEYTAKILIIDYDQMNILVAKSYLNTVQ